MYITHLSVIKKVGAWSTYFPDSIRLMIRRLATSWIKFEIIFIAVLAERSFPCLRQVFPMSLPDCSILLYIPYVDFWFQWKGNETLLSNARKHGTVSALIFNLLLLALLDTMRIMLTIILFLQLHNLQHKITFYILVLAPNQVPLKNLFHRKPS